MQRTEVEEHKHKLTRYLISDKDGYLINGNVIKRSAWFLVLFVQVLWQICLMKFLKMCFYHSNSSLRNPASEKFCWFPGAKCFFTNVIFLLQYPLWHYSIKFSLFYIGQYHKLWILPQRALQSVHIQHPCLRNSQEKLPRNRKNPASAGPWQEASDTDPMRREVTKTPERKQR